MKIINSYKFIYCCLLILIIPNFEGKATLDNYNIETPEKGIIKSIGEKFYEEKKYQEAAHWYITEAEKRNKSASDYLDTLPFDLHSNLDVSSKIEVLLKAWDEQREMDESCKKGLKLYEQNKIEEAAILLLQAAQAGDAYAQYLYADICFRQLDNCPHSIYEAAMWYFLSAENGHVDSLAVVNEIIPNVLASSNTELREHAIARHWTIERTLRRLKPLKPQDINNYLIGEHNRKINKLTSQKLPYLFDKCAAVMAYQLIGQIYSAVENRGGYAPFQEPTAFSIHKMSCRDQDSLINKESFVSNRVYSYQYGTVYKAYYCSLTNESFEEEVTEENIKDLFLKRPNIKPKINLLLKLLLDSIHEETRNMRAGEFIALTHRDYPWLIAGIKLWKEKNSAKTFNTPNFQEADLMQELSSMKKNIFPTSDPDKPNDDLKYILEQIEVREIWPDPLKDDSKLVKRIKEILDEYTSNVKKFFISPIAYEDSLIQNIQKRFLEKLNSQETLQIDCKVKEDLENLKTPLLMLLCQELHLQNVKSITECAYALMDAQRFFFALKNIKIEYSTDFKEKLPGGKIIKNILDELKKRGIDVIVSSVVQ